MLSTLLKCNINPNQHDENHRTPFMLANTLGKRSILEMLQEDLRIKKYNEELGIVLNTLKTVHVPLRKIEIRSDSEN
jgi:hypothetical protein